MSVWRDGADEAVEWPSITPSPLTLAQNIAGQSRYNLTRKCRNLGRTSRILSQIWTGAGLEASCPAVSISRLTQLFGRFSIIEAMIDVGIQKPWKYWFPRTTIKEKINSVLILLIIVARMCSRRHNALDSELPWRFMISLISTYLPAESDFGHSGLILTVRDLIKTQFAWEKRVTKDSRFEFLRRMTLRNSGRPKSYQRRQLSKQETKENGLDVYRTCFRMMRRTSCGNSFICEKDRQGEDIWAIVTTWAGLYRLKYVYN